MGDRADLIYHESQQAALCGVHAVNTLLQAPHFSEVEMAQIGQELDAAEHALMAAAGVESADYLQYVAEGSGNVAENGMFSIQVLSRALEVFGLQAVPLNSPDAAAARADPTTQEAFICNLQEHWFTIRCIHGAWWNLNSLYTAPAPLSAFHLSAYLAQLQEEGYTIFAVVGALPPSHPPDSDAERFVPGLSGRWYTPEEARAATQENEKLKEQGFAKALAAQVAEKASGGAGSWVTLGRPAKRALDAEAAEDPELARALAASMQDSNGPRGRSHGGAWGAGRALGSAVAASDEDADLAAAIAASLAGAARPAGQQAPAAAAAGVAAGGGSGDDVDPELAAAIAASMQPAGDGGNDHQQQQQEQQEPEAPAVDLPELPLEPEAGGDDAIEVAVRLPTGGRSSRRFRPAVDTVGHLAAFAAAQGAAMGASQLAVTFPRRVFSDWGQTLAEAGVGHKELVVVEPK